MLLPLRVLRTLRYYLVIPQVIALVPRLSLWLGLDALSLIMNALAAVFLLELDNIVFGYLVPPANRDEVVERAQFTVTKAELRFEIRWVKAPSILFVALAIIYSIYTAASPNREHSRVQRGPRRRRRRRRCRRRRRDCRARRRERGAAAARDDDDDVNGWGER